MRKRNAGTTHAAFAIRIQGLRERSHDERIIHADDEDLAGVFQAWVVDVAGDMRIRAGRGEGGGDPDDEAFAFQFLSYGHFVAWGGFHEVDVWDRVVHLDAVDAGCVEVP